jgi:hypothetical protein
MECAINFELIEYLFIADCVLGYSGDCVAKHVIFNSMCGARAIKLVVVVCARVGMECIPSVPI